MLGLITVFAAAVFLLAAYAAIEPRNPACERMAQAGGLRRGHYRSHGRGPVSLAQTDFF